MLRKCFPESWSRQQKKKEQPILAVLTNAYRISERYRVLSFVGRGPLDALVGLEFCTEKVNFWNLGSSSSKREQTHTALDASLHRVLTVLTQFSFSVHELPRKTKKKKLLRSMINGGKIVFVGDRTKTLQSNVLNSPSISPTKPLTARMRLRLLLLATIFGSVLTFVHLLRSGTVRVVPNSKQKKMTEKGSIILNYITTTRTVVRRNKFYPGPFRARFNEHEKCMGEL